MAVSYKRLFHLMIEREMTNAQLQQKAGFSANIIKKLMKVDYNQIDDMFLEEYRDLLYRDIVMYPYTVDELLMALEGKRERMNK